MKAKIFFLLLCAASFLKPQSADVANALHQIESGSADSAKITLAALIAKYPSNAEVKYLDAVLTENGDSAMVKFQSIVTNYPASKYADASAYWVVVYYYSNGLYSKAAQQQSFLKQKYPQSPYVPAAVSFQLTAKPDTSSRAVKPVPAKKDTGNYMVQVGAFSNQGNATALKQKLEAQGYTCTLQEKNIGGTIFYVICVGYYANETEAKIQAEIIDKKYNLKSRVITIGGK
jgi:cell division septation protein DedD